MSKEFLIRYVKIPAPKMAEYLQIMSDGNPLLKKWAKRLLGNRKLRIFREKLFAGDYKPGIDIPQDEYDKIMRVRSIQWEMCQGFAACVTLRTKVWASRVEGDQKTAFHDLYQEANFAFLDALYGYLGKGRKAEFQTYLWRAIDRRLRREVENQKLQLVPPSADGARELVRNYEWFRQKCGWPITFDEYVSREGLTDDEASVLIKAIAYVVPESEFKDDGSSEYFPDYTGYDTSGRTTDDFEEKVAAKELAARIRKCVELAELTDFQKELLEAACTNSGHGWKAKIAKKYNKSSTSAGQALKKACEKIRTLYDNQ